MWRDWALNGTRDATPAERWQQVEACADLLLSHIDQSVERREQLLASFEHLPLATRQRFLEDLQAFAMDPLDAETRRRIANKIREKVHIHRHFSHTRWALPAGVVNALEGVQRQFEPQDVSARYTWLFDHYLHLPQESPDLSREEQIFQTQREALEDILTTGGLSKILALAEVVERPYAVGFVLGKAKILEDDSAILPSLLTVEQEKIAVLASEYVRGRFANASWEWVDQLPLATWSVEQVSAFAQSLPCERRTWELVAQFGNNCIAHYWQHVRVLLDSNAEDVEYKVAMLLQHHRPWDAIKVLGMALHKKYSLRSSLFVEALEAGLKDQPEKASSEAHDDMLGYEIQELIRCLQSAQDVDMQQLAALEWGYLPLLDGYDAAPQALHTWLQQEPRFFAELLSLIFRSQHESEEVVEPPTKEQKARAQRAYTLLESWNRVPGTRNDDTVDETKLMEWVTTARRLCEQIGRLAVCDNRIGKVFAHSQKEGDDSWPCIPVRDVIEEVASEELIQGFEVEIFNKRGVYSKSPSEGGAQERRFAQQYTAYADACDIEWPRTAAALRRVAQQYEEDARRADEEVQERF
jgi:hypothetical protein